MKSIAFPTIAFSLMALASSHAAYIVHGSAQRTAGLGDAVLGTEFTGLGNATVTEVESEYGGDWTERGEDTGTASGIFDVTLTSGVWGSGNAAGTWTITDPLFWVNYGMAAITMHVGNGGGDPDHWGWKLTPGQLTGLWEYNKISGGGGGLSNLKLYSAGTGTSNIPVPDGGSTLLALGISLFGLGGVRRFLKA
jgi:hypothetical protein